MQHELETLGQAEGAAILLCDRGTLDGLAYWPGDPEDLWSSVHSSLGAELERYSAVIHLQTPAADGGYDYRNPIRTESAQAAALIDTRIAEVWADHPRVTTIPASGDFLVKANTALEVIGCELPGCCLRHVAAAG